MTDSEFMVFIAKWFRDHRIFRIPMDEDETEVLSDIPGRIEICARKVAETDEYVKIPVYNVNMAKK